MAFANIRDIEAGNRGSWDQRLFVTIDTDWASDSLLHYLADFLEARQVPATWFITNETSVLERLRANPDFEIGIHANFNDLLDGTSQSNAEEILATLAALVPEAVSVRSHSFTQSSRLLNLFAKFGFRYDCNTYLPLDSSFDACPFEHWNGMVRVPHCWEDDVWVITGRKTRPRDVLAYQGIRVIDIHPVHFYLNSADAHHLDVARQAHKSTAQFEADVNAGFGSRSFVQELIEGAGTDQILPPQGASRSVDPSRRNNSIGNTKHA